MSRYISAMTSCGSFAVTTFTSPALPEVFISRIRSTMASFKDIHSFAPPFPHLPLTQAYDARQGGSSVGGTQE